MGIKEHVPIDWKVKPLDREICAGYPLRYISQSDFGVETKLE